MTLLTIMMFQGRFSKLLYLVFCITDFLYFLCFSGTSNRLVVLPRSFSACFMPHSELIRESDVSGTVFQTSLFSVLLLIL